MDTDSELPDINSVSRMITPVKLPDTNTHDNQPTLTQSLEEKTQAMNVDLQSIRNELETAQERLSKMLKALRAKGEERENLMRELIDSNILPNKENENPAIRPPSVQSDNTTRCPLTSNARENIQAAPDTNLRNQKTPEVDDVQTGLESSSIDRNEPQLTSIDQRLSSTSPLDQALEILIQQSRNVQEVPAASETQQTPATFTDIVDSFNSALQQAAQPFQLNLNTSIPESPRTLNNVLDLNTTPIFLEPQSNSNVSTVSNNIPDTSRPVQHATDKSAPNAEKEKRKRGGPIRRRDKILPSVDLLNCLTSLAAHANDSTLGDITLPARPKPEIVDEEVQEERMDTDITSDQETENQNQARTSSITNNVYASGNNLQFADQQPDPTTTNPVNFNQTTPIPHQICRIENGVLTQMSPNTSANQNPMLDVLPTYQQATRQQIPPTNIRIDGHPVTGAPRPLNFIPNLRGNVPGSHQAALNQQQLDSNFQHHGNQPTPNQFNSPQNTSNQSRGDPSTSLPTSSQSVYPPTHQNTHAENRPYLQQISNQNPHQSDPFMGNAHFYQYLMNHLDPSISNMLRHYPHIMQRIDFRKWNSQTPINQFVQMQLAQLARNSAMNAPGTVPYNNVHAVPTQSSIMQVQTSPQQQKFYTCSECQKSTTRRLTRNKCSTCYQRERNRRKKLEKEEEATRIAAQLTQQNNVRMRSVPTPPANNQLNGIPSSLQSFFNGIISPLPIPAANYENDNMNVQSSLASTASGHSTPAQLLETAMFSRLSTPGLIINEAPELTDCQMDTVHVNDDEVTALALTANDIEVIEDENNLTVNEIASLTPTHEISPNSPFRCTPNFRISVQEARDAFRVPQNKTEYICLSSDSEEEH